MSSAGSNETVEMVKLGQVSVLRDRQLQQVEFSSFFPQKPDYAFVKTKDKFEKPDFYIQFIEQVRKDKKPLRLVVSDTPINFLASVEDFEYGYQAGTEDVYYTISLAEYRESTVKLVVIENKPSPPKPAQSRPNTSGAITAGCEVIVNGRLHRDSYGSGPGKTLRGYRGKVNYIKLGRGYPYHVTTPSGGWLGWVTAGSVKRA